MKMEMNKDGSTNFEERRKDLKPYKVYNFRNEIVNDFYPKFYELFVYYKDRVYPVVNDIDTVQKSIYNGCVDMEREQVGKLSEDSKSYLRQLEKLNNDFLSCMLKENSKNRLPTASSFRDILGFIKKVGKENLSKDEYKYFDSWFSYNSPSRYISKEMNTTTHKMKDKKNPEFTINYGFYTGLLGHLMAFGDERSSMLVIEMLTGRRISECNVNDFKWMDLNDNESRQKILDVYQVTNENKIDEFSWVLFSGQKKAKREVPAYPIPLVVPITEKVFNHWLNKVKNVVERVNEEKNIPVQFWGSEVGGVRHLRYLTVKLYTRLLPMLNKGHNLRAIHASILSKQLLNACNFTDTVKLMKVLTGHIDSGSTDKYRLVRVVQEELTVNDSQIINTLPAIITEAFTDKRKKTDVFIGWSEGDKKHYKRHLKDSKTFQNLKVITEGKVNFDNFSKISGDEYREKMNNIMKEVEYTTGLSYTTLVKRYNGLPFTTVYSLAQRVREGRENASAMTMKRHMDTAYAQKICDYEEIENDLSDDQHLDFTDCDKSGE